LRDFTTMMRGLRLASMKDIVESKLVTSLSPPMSRKTIRSSAGLLVRECLTISTVVGGEGVKG
jgi:hypothetical protein